MRLRLTLLLILLATLFGYAQDEHDHEGHDHEHHQSFESHDHHGGPGGFDVDARQHADEVENAVYEFMVRSFYTQPWRDTHAPEVMVGRAVPIWILVLVLFLARRFRGSR